MKRLALLALLLGACTPQDPMERYPDLAQYKAAYSAQIAQAEASGQITQLDATLLRAEMESQITDQWMARDAADKQSRAATSQALLGLAILNQQQQQANQPPPMALPGPPVRCYTNGPYTTCQ